MIVFNIKALVCGVAGLMAFAAFGSLSMFGLAATGTDVALRFLTGGEIEDAFSVFFSPRRGGTIFWIIPVWPLGILLLLGGFATGASGSTKAAAAVSATAAEVEPQIQRPDDSHLIEPPPPPVPTSVVLVQSTPADATVTVNRGRGGTTPVRLRLPQGKGTEVVVSKEGYVPLTRVVDVPATTSTLTVNLEKGVPIHLESNPIGAAIFIDSTPYGETPRDVLVVPKSRRFRLRVEKTGYKTWTKRLRRPKRNRRYVAKLVPLPLSKLPLSPDEKQELRDIRTQIGAAQRAFATAKMAFARAKTKAKNPRLSHYDRLDADNALEDARAEFDGREADLADVKTQLGGLRERVLLRMADE